MKRISKATILNRASRKYWYVKYQVLSDNSKVERREESVKVLKTEETLEYMTGIGISRTAGIHLLWQLLIRVLIRILNCLIR